MKVDGSVIERLKRFAVLASLAGDENALGELAGILEPRRYDAGQEIIHKGDRGDCAFLLVEGSVEVFDYTMDAEPFTRAVLDASLAPFFGEVALVGGGERIATVKARSACECWILQRKALIELGDRHPAIGWRLLMPVACLLAAHLEKTNRDVLRLFEALVLEVEHKTIY